VTIEAIFQAAKARNLVRSRREFSREYLGRTENYIADRGFGRCSAGALVNLFRRLGEAGHIDLQAKAFTTLLAAEERECGRSEVRP
jgi:hypothetical protein